MIVTVTLNPALDITHTVASLVLHSSHRVSDVGAQAGGKGINVARVLHTLGLPTVAVAFRGGPAGAAIAADLDSHGIAHRLVDIAGENRRTFAVVDVGSGDATVFNEPGPTVSGDEWHALREQVHLLLPDASVLVLSGSLPPGLPATAYAQLIRAAVRAGVPVILDAAGAPLRAGVAAGPNVVKPNSTELAEVTGLPDPLAAAEALRAAGAQVVVASLGPEGLLAVTPDGTFHAGPPEPLAGNPTGAGDSVVAAIAAGIHTGMPWPRRLAEAVALSAATVRAPRAGQFDAGTYHRLASRPVEFHTPRPHTT
jgi:tagatose 6-phosphate kinase